MAVKRIRADYPILTRITQQFTQEASTTQQTLDRIQESIGVLQQGDWVGLGATQFYQEMNAEVLPALKRLRTALAQTARVTAQMKQIMQQAETDAARVFVLRGGSAPTGNGDKPPDVPLAPSPAKELIDDGGGGGGGGGGSGGGESNVTGTITGTVNTRTSPGMDSDSNKTGNQLQPGDEITVIGVTYDQKNGYQWLLVETEAGEQVWIAGDFAELDIKDMQGVQIYDNDGNLVPEAELPLRSAEAEILLRYDIDLKMNEAGSTDEFRDPTVDDTEAVQGALADLKQLEEYGVTLAPKGTGNSTDEWTPNDIDQVNEGVVTQADGLYSFAQEHGFDVSKVTAGELYRNVYFEGNEITVYRNAEPEHPKGYYGYVNDSTITLYDAAFEGPLNVTGASDRPFTTQLLMQHEVQHQADFDHSSILSNNFAELENGTYQFQNEYTINYTDKDGNPQTYSITRDENGELPTLAEVEDDIGVDLVNTGSAAYTGMDFVVASAKDADELPIDITVAVLTGQGFRIGDGYSLAENLGAIVRQEWGTEQMIEILKDEGYTQSAS